MNKTMQDWFFMRPGFETFRFQPERHSKYMFGDDDRAQRDRLIEALEEAAYSRDGHKAAVYGDYGRGKTHLCHNVMFEIRRRTLPFAPVYVKCGAFKKKEPFGSLFREMVFGHTSDELQRVATAYAQEVSAGNQPALQEVIGSEDIAHVLATGLTVPNPEAVKTSMRWLAGEPKVPMGTIGGALKPQLIDPFDFGGVLKGLSHMLASVDEQVPLYIVDEAERFESIADPDTYFSWLATIRELTEIPEIGIFFMIGAKTRDQLPAIFVQPEIIRRIGVANYVELLNPGKDAIRSFLLEQLRTTIRKGAVPEAQREIVAPEALDDVVPDELKKLVDDDDDRLEVYPFEPDAFETFVQQVATGEMANKPSEAQLRLQKAAQRAMRLDQKLIDLPIVEAIQDEGF